MRTEEPGPALHVATYNVCHAGAALLPAEERRRRWSSGRAQDPETMQERRRRLINDVHVTYLCVPYNILL